MDDIIKKKMIMFLLVTVFLIPTSFAATINTQIIGLDGIYYDYNYGDAATLHYENGVLIKYSDTNTFDPDGDGRIYTLENVNPGNYLLSTWCEESAYWVYVYKPISVVSEEDVIDEVINCMNDFSTLTINAGFATSPFTGWIEGEWLPIEVESLYSYGDINGKRMPMNTGTHKLSFKRAYGSTGAECSYDIEKNVQGSDTLDLIFPDGDSSIKVIVTGTEQYANKRALVYGTQGDIVCSNWWYFINDEAVFDNIPAGDYVVEMVCPYPMQDSVINTITAPVGQQAEITVNCAAPQRSTVDIEVKFQDSSDPVPRVSIQTNYVEGNVEIYADWAYTEDGSAVMELDYGTYEFTVSFMGETTTITETVDEDTESFTIEIPKPEKTLNVHVQDYAGDPLDDHRVVVRRLELYGAQIERTIAGDVSFGLYEGNYKLIVFCYPNSRIIQLITIDADDVYSETVTCGGGWVDISINPYGDGVILSKSIELKDLDGNRASYTTSDNLNTEVSPGEYTLEVDLTYYSEVLAISDDISVSYIIEVIEGQTFIMGVPFNINTGNLGNAVVGGGAGGSSVSASGFNPSILFLSLFVLCFSIVFAFLDKGIEPKNKQ
ncbi:hypothetical protein ACFL6I_16205 [candidate division KSB1 bacterium]